MPLFSIIIPSYNQEEFLEENVQSILEQDFTDWELLIVDDGSTDQSLALAYELAKMDKRISVLEKKNGGLSSSRNFGIRHAKGDYLYFIDADDLMLPGLLHLASQRALNNKPDVIQFGYRYLLHKDKRILYNVLPRERFEIPDIFMGSPGSSHSFILAKEIIAKAGYFDEGLRSIEDWDYWLRVFKCKPKVSIIDKSLVDYRQHELSMSRNYFVMYDAFKEVALRATKYDSRITIDSVYNRDYDFDMLPVIKKGLKRFTALAVLQGKEHEAISLFKNESNRFHFEWHLTDFSEMNNYLTFRYRYSKEDLDWVFGRIVPRFASFFKALNYSEKDLTKIIRIIFRYHLSNRNIYRFGFVGRVFNYFSFYPGY